MQVDVLINASKEDVWRTITDIENASEYVDAILNIEILERPDTGLLGLRWRETREIFGKKADETMWITEARENSYYQTCAKNSGALYTSKFAIEELDDNCRLTMCFSAETQTFGAKILALIFTPFMRGSMQKMILKDLENIRDYIESK